MEVTMDLLDRMDAQDVFDVVAWHLLRQGVQSTDERGHCMYRGLNNTRCAIGWLIPDSVYTPEMEHRYVADLPKQLEVTHGRYRFASFVRRHIHLLLELQRVHDHGDPLAWPALLRALARRGGLDDRVVSHWPLPVLARTLTVCETLAGPAGPVQTVVADSAKQMRALLLSLRITFMGIT